MWHINTSERSVHRNVWVNQHKWEKGKEKSRVRCCRPSPELIAGPRRGEELGRRYTLCCPEHSCQNDLHIIWLNPVILAETSGQRPNTGVWQLCFSNSHCQEENKAREPSCLPLPSQSWQQGHRRNFSSECQVTKQNVYISENWRDSSWMADTHKG